MPTTAPIVDIQLLEHPVEPMPWSPFPEEAGGECVFLGRTRVETHAEHGRLERLSYEAYRPMALRVLRELADRAMQRFSCSAVRLHHAVGDVPPGDASVLVQVAAPHRAEAFEAARFLIDELKKTAPIWKREQWADGTTWSEGAPVAEDVP